MEVNFQLGCERPIGLHGKIIRLVRQMLEQRLAVELHHVAHLGRENIIRALGDSLTDQPDSLLEARLRQQPRAHLHHRGSKGALGTHDVASSPASSASSLPARSYICWR